MADPNRFASPSSAEIPPHSAEIERGVLGAVLQEPETLELVLRATEPTHFLIDRNRMIRTRLAAMLTAGQAVDTPLLISALDAAGELDQVGGRAYIAQLYGEGAIPAALDGYIRELRALWAKRRQAQVGTRMRELAMNGGQPGAIIQEVRASLAEIERALGLTVDGGPRIKALSWRELTAEPPAPIAYHWDGWVPLAAVALVVGAGEALKSWLTLLLAICAAAGLAPLAEPEDQTATPMAAGPVLYFTAENAIDEERRRATLLKAGLGLSDDLPITFVPAESLNLSNEEDFAAVVALVKDVQPAAVFIDSAIALSGLSEENDNAEVRAFMKARILPLARFYGCTVYLVAHSPKSPTQPGARLGDEHVVRGASDWRNAADIVLFLKRDATLGSAAVLLKHAKVRIGRRHAPIWFSLEDVDPGISVRMIYGGGYDEDTEQGKAHSLARAVQAAVAVLKDKPAGAYLETVKTQLVLGKIAEATARRALDVLRGKIPWPHGKLKGQKHAIVTEDKQGRRVFIALALSNIPDHEDSGDA